MFYVYVVLNRDLECVAGHTWYSKTIHDVLECHMSHVSWLWFKLNILILVLRVCAGMTTKYACVGSSIHDCEQQHRTAQCVAKCKCSVKNKFKFKCVQLVNCFYLVNCCL